MPIIIFIIFLLSVLIISLHSTGVIKNDSQSMDFFLILCDALSCIFIGLCIFAILYKIMSFFSPSIKCLGISCK